MTPRQAHEAMLTLRKWCRQQGNYGCGTCIFRRGGRRKDTMESCKIGDGDIPEFWDISYVNGRVKWLEEQG